VTRVRFEAVAHAEFLAAVEWYADRSQRVAWRLVGAIEEALDEIRAAPESWPTVSNVPGELGVRRRILKKFPYAVVFMVVCR
jgi:plasmid stabilization system protein ParE